MDKWYFSSCFYHSGCIYFQNEGASNAGKYNILENRMHYAPEMDIRQSGVSHYIDEYIKTRYGIYGLTVSGEHLIKFNIHNASQHIIELSANNREWGNYATIQNYDDIIYIFLQDVGELIEYDTKTDVLMRNQAPIGIKAGCEYGDGVVLFKSDSKKIIYYNFESKEFEECISIDSMERIVCAESYGDRVFAISENGMIYEFLVKSRRIRLCDEYELVKGYYPASICIIPNRRIICIPSDRDEIYYIDINTHEVGSISNQPNYYQLRNSGWSRYYGYVDADNIRYYAMRSTNCILRINKDTSDIEYIKPEYPKDSEMVNYHKNNQGYIMENELSIYGLLDYLKNDYSLPGGN